MFVYLGHHKCASSWINDVLNAICNRSGLTFVNVHNESMFKKQDLTKIDFLSDTGTCLGNLDLLTSRNIEYLGFHVIRDPRDIVVSAYFSHRKTHPIGIWLEAHRDRLNSVSLEAGIRLEIDFRSRQFDAMSKWNYNNPRVYETRFELVTPRPASEFKKIFQFLGIIPNYLPSYLQLERILGNHTFERMSAGRKKGEEDTNHHYRKGIHGDWVNYIHGSNKDYFKERFGQLLIDLGYEKNFDW